MQKVLVILTAVLAAVYSLVSYPFGALAAILAALIVVPVVWKINKAADREFLINVFLIALLARLGLGLLIYTFELITLFGPDAYTFDYFAAILTDSWRTGNPIPERVNNRFSLSGWAMYYIVAFIYLIFGRSILVAQAFCGTIGACTIPLVYACAQRVFKNKRVSRYSAIAVAIFPSFVIWSSQVLKDGLIVFLLVVLMISLLEIQNRFTLTYLGILLSCLAGILALRFYVFYMVAVSVVGSFVVGVGTTNRTMLRNFIAILIIGVGITYFGSTLSSNQDLTSVANLERIQFARENLSVGADSGFGSELDVSTTEGALTAIPMGLWFLFFAPFPWQAEKASQILIIPETLLWWSLIPVMILGIGYTVQNKMRPALPILLFTSMLSLVYSLVQGNVGMMYRQRTQIQVFAFMFIAVGITYLQEKRENRIPRLRIAKAKEITKLKQSNHGIN